LLAAVADGFPVALLGGAFCFIKQAVDLTLNALAWHALTICAVEWAVNRRGG
jgi:hypothetical protein